MFENEMNELLELGKRFVGAVEKMSQATKEETDKQVAIIRQARTDLQMVNKTQNDFVVFATNIANAMDDIAEQMKESVMLGEIAMSCVDDMEDEIRAEFDTEEDEYHEEDEDEDHEEEDESNE